MVAAFLVLNGDYDSADDALEFYAHCRTKNAKGARASHNSYSRDYP